ncbi:hypothetical protein lerEdw1_010533 [Lerista edwardsae]|nr:hypothetical protein lerEdw1_010533 [Lerista edwardsae]
MKVLLLPHSWGVLFCQCILPVNESNSWPSSEYKPADVGTAQRLRHKYGWAPECGTTAAAHSQRKKTLPHTTMKQPLSPKKALCKKTPSPKKQLELKQGKQEQKKLAMKLHNTKDSQLPSAPAKGPQQLHQTKAPLSAKGHGKSISVGKNLNSKMSSQAKYAKIGRGLCTLSCEDLQQELNALMCKQITSRVFAKRSCVPH